MFHSLCFVACPRINEGQTLDSHIESKSTNWPPFKKQWVGCRPLMKNGEGGLLLSLHLNSCVEIYVADDDDGNNYKEGEICKQWKMKIATKCNNNSNIQPTNIYVATTPEIARQSSHLFYGLATDDSSLPSFVKYFYTFLVKLCPQRFECEQRWWLC